jgi:hypothetical protein
MAKCCCIILQLAMMLGKGAETSASILKWALFTRLLYLATPKCLSKFSSVPSLCMVVWSQGMRRHILLSRYMSAAPDTGTQPAERYQA